MNARSIESLRSTWPCVIRHPKTKRRFFEKLSEQSPQLEIFLINHLEQDSSCILNFILSHIIHLNEEGRIQQDLHHFPIISKIRPENYGYIKKALVQTVHEVLGMEFNPAIHEAWDTALSEILVIMMNASTSEEYVFVKNFDN